MPHKEIIQLLREVETGVGGAIDCLKRKRHDLALEALVNANRISLRVVGLLTGMRSGDAAALQYVRSVIDSLKEPPQRKGAGPRKETTSETSPEGNPEETSS